MRTGAKEKSGDDGESVTCGEDGTAMRNAVTDPAAEIGGSGVKDVVHGVEDDREAGGAGRAMLSGEHARGVED